MIQRTSDHENPNHAANKRVFPLSLAPIDWFFYRDDCSQYPMVFYVDLDFSGRLDHERMAIALTEAIYRHPLMYAIVQPGRRNRPSWVLAPERLPKIDWGPMGTPLDTGGSDSIDITQVPGLRVWARESETSTKVTMQFHHATCDGTGAYRFIGDLLGCYIRQLPSCADKVEMGTFDAKQLRLRPSKMRSLTAGASFMQAMKCGVQQGWKTFGARITALRAPKARPDGASFPGIITHEFSGDDQKKLRNVATELGVTMNDLLIWKLFQAIGVWNGSMGEGRKLRMLVPSDMRAGDDFEQPACNMTAYTFLTHNAGELANAEQLLASIRQDTLQIKHGNLQQQFIDGLTSAMSNPNFLTFLLRRNFCLATCVLSNAGDPAKRFTCRLPKTRGKVSCDDFTLEAITGVPPLRRNTRSTLSVSSYGRKLIFSMRCDPHRFSQADTTALLDVFCDQLRPLLADQDET
tara:strand:- start:87619 stop:89007 length:1389 start_codon:yes stop_codon:yes gene_type:complete